MAVSSGISAVGLASSVAILGVTANVAVLAGPLVCLAISGGGMGGEKSRGRGRARLASCNGPASSPSATISMFGIVASPTDGPSRSFATSAITGPSISYAGCAVPTAPSEIGCRSVCRRTDLMGA